MQNHSSGFGTAGRKQTHILHDIPISGPAPGSRGINQCQSGPKTRQPFPLLERNLCCMRAIHVVCLSTTRAVCVFVCGPVARHACTAFQDDDTSLSLGPGCTFNRSRQSLRLPDGRPSPAFRPFEPNTHGQ